MESVTANQGGQPPAPNTPMQQGNLLRYEGKLLRVYGISVINFFLTILTFFIYRPWARTRMRRYVYGKIMIKGDPLRYTGTGGELFGAMVFVFAIYFAFSLMLGATDLVAMFMVGVEKLQQAQETGEFTAYHLVSWVTSTLSSFALVYVIFFGNYTGRRYRLTRSKWHGVHGNLVGKPLRYANKAFLLFLLNIITLGLIKHRNDMKLRSIMVQDLRFGNVECGFANNYKVLNKVHFITWALAIPTLGLSRLWYKAALMNQFMRQMTAGRIVFDATHTGNRWGGLVIGNFLLMMTFIGVPWAIQRYVKYMTKHIVITGEIDEASLLQGGELGKATGDILDDFDGGIDFDMGVF